MYTGGCHCGNLGFEMEITSRLSSYSPRTCDCSFCQKHSASYISDNQGKLTIYIEDKNNFNKYRHGDRIADFLICQICGVLIGVCYQNQECLYAAINSKAIDQNPDFQPETIVSPKMLNSQEKIQRWKNAWFSNVSLEKVSR